MISLLYSAPLLQAFFSITDETVQQSAVGVCVSGLQWALTHVLHLWTTSFHLNTFSARDATSLLCNYVWVSGRGNSHQT